MQYLKALAVACLMATPIAAAPSKQCQSGTYQCLNSITPNGTSTVQVCGNGAWLLAAVCEAGEKCVQDKAGGVQCVPY